MNFIVFANFSLPFLLAFIRKSYICLIISPTLLLTNEEGYKKLNELNLIDEEKMGSFKVDKVFKEIAIISNRRYVATTIDGERVFHCINNLSYEDVIDIAKE